MRRRVIIILAMLILGSVIALFFGSWAYFRTDELNIAKSRLNLYSRSLSDTLDRFEYLPFILAKDGFVVQALSSANLDGMNERFEGFAQKSGLEAIYLMDENGFVIASSNHNQTPTFLGKNYGFRPYFKAALQGEQGRYFGVGATTGRPGYFFAQPVINAQGQKLGVLSVKLDMSEFQASWEASGESVLVTNALGVVVLATNPQWLYKTIQRMSDDARRALQSTRQFGVHDLDYLDWREQADQVSIADDTFLHVYENKQDLGWKIHYLQDQDRVWQRASSATAVFGSAVVFLVLVATYLRSTRIQQALLRAQADRNQLHDTHQQLEEAHKELKRTGHLAALGRVAASITHELGQPISALKNYLSAGEIGGEFKRGKTLSKIDHVVDRMENISKELKFFNEPRNDKHVTVNVVELLKNAIELTRHDLEAEGIELVLDFQDRALPISGNKFRLERVFVNLIKNAAEAMREADEKRLTISARTSADHVVCQIADTGHGLGDLSLETLREPFFTSKPSGKGMGLGLSIASQIVSEHKGELTARAGSHSGAIFEVTLPNTIVETKPHQRKEHA